MSVSVATDAHFQKFDAFFFSFQNLHHLDLFQTVLRFVCFRQVFLFKNVKRAYIVHDFTLHAQNARQQAASKCDNVPADKQIVWQEATLPEGAHQI